MSVPLETPYSRRHTLRVVTPDDVWVYWRCDGIDDVSRVRDLGVGGLYIATQRPRPPGIRAKLDLLVQEGQIRAAAVVRHSEPGRGLGMQFTAVTGQDCAHLVALMTRMRSLPVSLAQQAVSIASAGTHQSSLSGGGLFVSKL